MFYIQLVIKLIYSSKKMFYTQLVIKPVFFLQSAITRWFLIT